MLDQHQQLKINLTVDTLRSVFHLRSTVATYRDKMMKLCLIQSSLYFHQGAPFSQLRKSSSVQSFGSEQKKKNDRSADYRPEADR